MKKIKKTLSVIFIFILIFTAPLPLLGIGVREDDSFLSDREEHYKALYNLLLYQLNETGISYGYVTDLGKDKEPVLIMISPQYDHTYSVTENKVVLITLPEEEPIPYHLSPDITFLVRNPKLADYEARYIDDTSIMKDIRDGVKYIEQYSLMNETGFTWEESILYTIIDNSLEKTIVFSKGKEYLRGSAIEETYYINSEQVNKDTYFKEYNNYEKCEPTFNRLRWGRDDNQIMSFYQSTKEERETVLLMIAKKYIDHLSILNNYTGSNFYEFHDQELNRETLIFGDIKLKTKNYVNMQLSNVDLLEGLHAEWRAHSEYKHIKGIENIFYDLEEAYIEILVNRKKVDVNKLEEKLADLIGTVETIDFNNKEQKDNVVSLFKITCAY